MDSLSIDKILRKVSKPHYRGCYASDRIPLPTGFPSIMVVNLDPHYMDGSHWVVVHAESPTRANFFCPFGREPTGNLMDFL